MRLRGPVLTVLTALAASLVAAPAASADADPIDVLVYSATYGFRHDSIDTGKLQFAGLGAGEEFDVKLTEDPGDINAATLEGFDVLVFLNATGNHPFSQRQKLDLQEWLATGKGVVSTHASIDGNYSWSDYGDLTGAYFHSHPHTGVATNVVEDKANPLVAHLPERVDLNDEYYRFQLDPRPNVHVLASLDRASMGNNGTTYIDKQPVTWCQHVGGGRSFTTAWGHFDDVFKDAKTWPAMVQGVRWAAGRLEADCSVKTVPGRVQAENATIIGGAEKQSSPFDGANQVVTRIQHDGYVLFRDLDLTDVKTVKVAAAPETVPTPSPYSFPQATPALGGTVSVVLDDLNYDNQSLGGSGPTYKVAGSATLAPTRPPTTPLDGAAAGNPEGYPTLEIPIEAAGRHDVYVVFTNGAVEGFNPFRIFAPTVPESMLLGSVDWVEFPGLRNAPAPGLGAPSTGTAPTSAGQGTGTGTTPAPTRSARRVRLVLPRRLTASRSRVTLRVPAGLFAAGTRLAARLTRAGGTLATGRTRAARGTTRLTLRLNARARRLLRRSPRVGARLSFTAVEADGTRTTATRRVTLGRRLK